jgi:methionyl-tRNA formyltransferase
VRKKRVVFLGAKEIGLECLKILHQNTLIFNYDIVAILTNDRGIELFKYAEANNLSIIHSLDDYLMLKNIDICISIQYHEILKKEHINIANELTINLHMAPLPEYRGCNQFSFALINEDKEFGTTIHKINEEIDSGDILFESRFEIPHNYWVEDLYELTLHKSVELFKDSLEKIINLDVTPIKQAVYIANKSRSCNIYYRKEIELLKNIDLKWDEKKIQKHIRATSMKGFEPPYCIVGKEKVYFTKR